EGGARLAHHGLAPELVHAQHEVRVVVVGFVHGHSFRSSSHYHMRRRRIGPIMRPRAVSWIVLCTVAAVGASAAPPTGNEARAFVENAEARLLDLSNRNSRADWIYQNFITDDTEKALAEAADAQIAATMELAAEGRRFEGAPLPPDVARRLQLLKLSLDLPAPSDPRLRNELTEIAAWLPGTYGK